MDSNDSIWNLIVSSGLGLVLLFARRFIELFH